MELVEKILFFRMMLSTIRVVGQFFEIFNKKECKYWFCGGSRASRHIGISKRAVF